MSVQAIMEAPADPEAGAREIDVELALTQALARATSAEEQGRLHDELARHYARRTMYRKMNRHETASIQAYARGVDGGPLAEALALHGRALAAFAARDDAQGRTLLRAARELAIAHLPLRHSWVLRVTHTLAGRIARGTEPGAPPVIDEIIGFHELLERETIANCGPDHFTAMRAISELAHAYESKGRHAEALTRFERCFLFHVDSPRRVHEARVLLGVLAAIFRAIDDPDGVARFEDLLLARDPTAARVVQRSRFDRDPALRATFDRRAVEHAAPLFVGRVAAARFAKAVAMLDEPASAGATVVDAITGAVLAVERETGIAPEEDDEADDVAYAHPLCEAEWAFQKALYEALWADRVARGDRAGR